MQRDLADRKRQVAKWAWAEPELLARVNAIAEQEWERGPQSRWHWNCLTYMAAQLVTDQGKTRRLEERVSVSEEEESETEKEDVGGWSTWTFPGPSLGLRTPAGRPRRRSQ